MNLIVNLILKIMSVRLVIAFDKWCLIVERMFFTKGKAGDARMEMIGRVILIDAFLEKNEMVAAMCRLAGERRDGGTGPLGAAARGRSPKYGGTRARRRAESRRDAACLPAVPRRIATRARGMPCVRNRCRSRRSAESRRCDELIVPARFDVSAPRRAAPRRAAMHGGRAGVHGGVRRWLKRRGAIGGVGRRPVHRRAAARRAARAAARVAGPAPDRSEMEQHVPNSNRRCAARGGPFISARPSGGMVWIVHFRFPALRAAQHETHRHNQETT
ncbi:hypothetical protein [Burkholderia pseudomallei]|uniref:hypothetical protein n=3 Tax=Burkholderia pseudomallei TaxID=28450 RepID=UPI001FCC9C53